MNIVRDTASTDNYEGTIFPGGIRYSLVNNVRGVRYSLGYRIHSDTGLTSAKRVGGLYKIRESVLTSAKRVRDLYNLWGCRFDIRLAGCVTSLWPFGLV